MIYAPVKYPGTNACAQKLIATPNEDRYEYLRALLDQLNPYLADKQDQLVRRSLATLYSAIKVSKNPEFVEPELYALRKISKLNF